MELKLIPARIKPPNWVVLDTPVWRFQYTSG